MSAPLARRALGFDFSFASDDAGLCDVVETAYECLPRCDDPGHEIRVVIEGDRGAVTLRLPTGEVETCEPGVELGSTLEVIAWEVNARATASRADRPIIHAAATAGPAGAVILCGAPHSGKTTMAATAAQHGWGHLSDDLAPIEIGTMSVEPYARPLMIRDEARHLIGELPPPPAAHQRFVRRDRFVPASALGARVVADPQPLVAVVTLSWSDRTELQPMSKAHTLQSLAATCTTLAKRGRDGFEDLQAVAVAVPGFRLRLSDPRDALQLLAPLVGAG